MRVRSSAALCNVFSTSSLSLPSPPPHPPSSLRLGRADICDLMKLPPPRVRCLSMNERPQVTPGARRQEEDSGTEGSRVYFYFAAVGHCQREPNLARLSPPLRIVTFSTLLLFLLLCSAGALKSRRRPLKRDHSIGSSQQPPPPPPPPPPRSVSLSLPFSKTSPGLDRAVRGHAAKLQLPGAPSDAASDVGNAFHYTPPSHPPTPS